MKFLPLSPRAALLSCALLGSTFSLAQAQPQVVPSGATVAVPVATNDDKVRLRLRNGAAYLDEETSKREGNVVRARLDAEPGLYEIRARSYQQERRLRRHAARCHRAGSAPRSGRLALQRFDLDSQISPHCHQAHYECERRSVVRLAYGNQ